MRLGEFARQRDVEEFGGLNWCALAVEIFSIASLTVKLAALARGGNSLKVSSTFPTIACAGTNRNARWACQSA